VFPEEVVEEEKIITNVTETTNSTTNQTISANTTSNESLSNETSSNETTSNETEHQIILKNETTVGDDEKKVESGMSIKFNNYFEYAIGSNNHSQQGQCQEECQKQYQNRSMCCVSVKMFPKDSDYLFT